MKFFLSALALLFSISFFGCSNLDDSSPIAPELSKPLLNPNDISFNYEYLQCFSNVMVDYFGEVPDQDGVLEIRVAQAHWPSNFGHLYAVLEYREDAGFCETQMLFINKPTTYNFTIPDVELNNLEDVKLFAFCLSDDMLVEPPYTYKTCFEELDVANWQAKQGEITIELDNLKSGLGDTFVEIQIKDGRFLTFVEKPDGTEIIIPKFGDLDITGVNIYALFE
ncbi:MAG: hypothetical protein KJN64_15590 [Ignavibacteria bacterium]|nr:hypothetical protein [Ignavibacteria bacterium]MBT8392830.1 hypothetical protein [Ignavibacteria bacterium]NNJ53608.1 hypothetical protein [Ignavibacteriaceae bacterium]NNL20215.1 hypothetical protein [Ignavibacteriaceae bacterium]